MEIGPCGGAAGTYVRRTWSTGRGQVASFVMGSGADSSTGSTTEGIDTERVSAWMRDTIDGSKPPFAFDLIAGGRSNLTYRVTDAAGAAYALRRPPLSHVLPTAHDMAREHTVISALGLTDVPVPAHARPLYRS